MKLIAPFVLVAGSLLSVWGHAQGYTYRYTNDEGVEVLSNTIPPQYVHQGYEVLSPSGRVVQVVKAAPDPELVEEERRLAELRQKYEHLAKRYSSVRDIEAAKQRKLVHVDASILLVEGSIANIQEEIDEIMAQAANYERAGKAVPEKILSTLNALNEKMSATRAIEAARFAEKKEIVDRFEADKELFTRGVKAFEPASAQAALGADEE